MGCKNCKHKKRTHTNGTCRVAFCECVGFEEDK